MFTGVFVCMWVPTIGIEPTASAGGLPGEARMGQPEQGRGYVARRLY